jgi:hypothetical protein
MGESAQLQREVIAAQWPCLACSYVNAAITSSCDMCGTQQEGVTTSSRLGRANSRKRKLSSASATSELALSPTPSDDGTMQPTKKRSGKPADTFEPTGFLGQGMSGSLTRKSVSDILVRCELKDGDRFIDLGAGVGNVSLQAAEDFPGLEWSRGIEVIEEAWAESCFRSENLRNSGKRIAPLQFHLGDLMTTLPEHLCDASHVYIFAAGMPPELQLQLFRLLNNCDFVAKIICVIDGSLGQNKTSLSTLLNKSKIYKTLDKGAGRLNACMRGSRSGKTVVIFERVDGK